VPDPQVQQHARESEFHDQWALDTPLEAIAVRQSFEAPTAPENRFCLRQMNRLLGSLRGRRLLDIGCGLGETSVYFAMQGAQVTASDISPHMVETAQKLAQLNGVEVQGLVSAGESLDVPEGAFDVVFTANTLHHVADKRRLLSQIHRALRPGGVFFSWDPLAYNPAINVYRRIATTVRTVDEAPLTMADVRVARELFVDVHHREFWIATLVLFGKYFLIDRVHPNADRYWKRCLKETNRSLWWWQPFRLADVVLTRLPLVRRLAWNMVIWGRKPGQ
jgi:2-polyprenyl-3-methyl-5-hydroxy-6-metoxy-1,4-benzoquinol methylase